MPFEEEDLDNIYQETITYANRKICEKLQEIASVENLVELRAEFEKRVRSYFKGIEESNGNESRTYCLNLLTSLSTAKLSDIKIQEI